MRCFTLVAALLLSGAGTGALLSPSPAQAATRCVYEVAPPYPANLWVRSGPGSQYDPVGAVGYGETVEGSCETRGNWTRVWADGYTGWAYRPYLQEVGY